MRWYQKIVQAHTAVTEKVSHFRQMQESRYMVWQEAGRNDFEAGNRHVEKAWTGTTDIFTTIEFDPWIDALENQFDALGIAYQLENVDYDDETDVMHYEYSWEVKDGPEDG